MPFAPDPTADQSLLNIKSPGDVRAFIHTNAAGISAALIAAASIAPDTAKIIVSAVGILVAVTDSSLSAINTRSGFRVWLYPVLAAVGGLLVVLGVVTDTDWASWVAIVPILFGQSTANANTDTTLSDTKAAGTPQDPAEPAVKATPDVPASTVTITTGDVRETPDA